MQYTPILDSDSCQRFLHLCLHSIASRWCVWHTWRVDPYPIIHTYDSYIWHHGQRRSDKNNYDCQNFKQVFMGVPVNFKQVFTGVSKITNKFSLEWTGVRVTRKRNRENRLIWRPKCLQSDLICEQWRVELRCMTRTNDSITLAPPYFKSLICVTHVTHTHVCMTRSYGWHGFLKFLCI